MALAVRLGYPLFALLLAAVGLGAWGAGEAGPPVLLGIGVPILLLVAPARHLRLRGRTFGAALARWIVLGLVTSLVLLALLQAGAGPSALATTGVALGGYVVAFAAALRMAAPDPRRRRATGDGGSGYGGGDAGGSGDVSSGDAGSGGCAGFGGGDGNDANDGDGEGGDSGGGDGGGGDGGGGGD